MRPGTALSEAQRALVRAAVERASSVEIATGAADFGYRRGYENAKRDALAEILGDEALAGFAGQEVEDAAPPPLALALLAVIRDLTDERLRECGEALGPCQGAFQAMHLLGDLRQLLREASQG